MNSSNVAEKEALQIEGEPQQQGCWSCVKRFSSKLFKPAHDPVRRADNDREHPLLHRRQV